MAVVRRSRTGPTEPPRSTTLVDAPLPTWAVERLAVLLTGALELTGLALPLTPTLVVLPVATMVGNVIPSRRRCARRVLPRTALGPPRRGTGRARTRHPF